jgi:hypothetical protein
MSGREKRRNSKPTRRMRTGGYTNTKKK